MGKPGGQLFSCHISGEMSLGKCKFSMDDVIPEFKSGAKNGHYFLNQCDLDLKISALPVKFIPLGFRLTPLSTHSVMGRESPIKQ